MPAKLSVNMNAIALLRNRRDLPWPNVVELGRVALGAGAHGLTVHPRPDQRHTRFTDLPMLRALIDDEFPQCEFNVEGYPTDEFFELVFQNEPEQVTLVPDEPDQPTSDHGWDFIGKENYLRDRVQILKDKGYRVSLFCDPDADEHALEVAKSCGADRVEFYTGPYGSKHDDAEGAEAALIQLAQTASRANAMGLDVNAGHDLTVENVKPLAGAIPELAEVSIGHGLTADCLIYGMDGSVRRFLAALGW